MQGWRLERMGALLFVGSFQHPVVTGPIFKLQTLNHIWSNVNVCLHLSCLAPGIKFPSNKSGNCILSSLCSISFSPLVNILMIFCHSREEIFLALLNLFYFLGSKTTMYIYYRIYSHCQCELPPTYVEPRTLLV